MHCMFYQRIASSEQPAWCNFVKSDGFHLVSTIARFLNFMIPKRFFFFSFSFHLAFLVKFFCEIYSSKAILLSLDK